MSTSGSTSNTTNHHHDHPSHNHTSGWTLLTVTKTKPMVIPTCPSHSHVSNQQHCHQASRSSQKCSSAPATPQHGKSALSLSTIPPCPHYWHLLRLLLRPSKWPPACVLISLVPPLPQHQGLAWSDLRGHFCLHLQPPPAAPSHCFHLLGGAGLAHAGLLPVLFLLSGSTFPPASPNNFHLPPHLA